MKLDDTIYVAGHGGLVGSALHRTLSRRGFNKIITRTRKELDLCNQSAVDAFFASNSPSIVFMAAAKVGGILANDTYPADFLNENLQIQNNVIAAAHRHGAAKFLFLGSSCIYPKFAEQPIREDSLLTGPLEPTNEWYAIAKIAGIKMCQAYRRQYGFNAIAAMPTNLYGPEDNFDLQNSHVLPALIRKFDTAKSNEDAEVVVWGTGKPRREFMHVDDLADALCHLMAVYDSEEIINIGTGTDITIADLAEMIKKITGFRGSIVYDTSKPDGTPRKLLDVSRLAATGWQPSIPLEEGIRSTYHWYLNKRPVS